MKKILLSSLLLVASSAMAASNYEIRLPSGSSTVAVEEAAPAEPSFTLSESQAAWAQFATDTGRTYSASSINFSGESFVNSATGAAYAGDGKVPNEPLPDAVITADLSFPVNQLTHVEFLSSVTSVLGHVLIYSNQLSNLDGLSNLTTVGGVFYANGNQLTNLDGLLNLTSTGNLVQLHQNPLLTDVSGLSNLASVGGALYLDAREYTVKAAGDSPFCQAIGSTITLAVGVDYAIKSQVCTF